MKRIVFITFLYTLFNIDITAQISNNCNLIKNGTFESITPPCPTFPANYPQLMFWHPNPLINMCQSNTADLFSCGFNFSAYPVFSTPPIPYPSDTSIVGIITNSSYASGCTSVSGGNYYKEYIGQEQVNLCPNQKYVFNISITQNTASPIGSLGITNDVCLFAGNQSLPVTATPITSCVPNSFSILASISANLITPNWVAYSVPFITTNSFSSVIIGPDCGFASNSNGYVYMDNTEILPVDTLSITPSSITTCDSAIFVLSIPGCYGPYDVIISDGVVLDTLFQIANNYQYTVFPTQNTSYTVTSIINSLGCKTNLNIPFSAIIGINTTYQNIQICEGENYTLPGGNTVNNASTYYDTIFNANGCDSIIITNLNIVANPFTTISGNNTINVGESTLLTASGGINYTWFPSTGLNNANTNNVIASPIETTTYCVTITNNIGCKDSLCISIYVENLCVSIEKIVIPNAFSPNGDDVNDKFCIKGLEYCIDDILINIYNRWGEKVFESKDSNFCWDGTYYNKTLDAQVFTCYIVLSDKKSKKKYNLNKNISLIK